jgi:hypothetical protein
MEGDYGYLITLLEEQQQQIVDLNESQRETVAVIGEHHAEEIENQQGISDALSVVILAIGILIGGVLVLIFSSGLRNAS